MPDASPQSPSPASHTLLASLPRAATDRMLAQAEVVRHEQGDLLISEGNPSDSILLISEGEVVILKGTVEIDRQKAGGVLGEMGVLTDQPRTATVKCVTPVLAHRISAADFLEAIEGHPEVMRSLIGELVGKVKGTHGFRVEQEQRLQEAVDILTRCVSEEVLQRILREQSPEDLLQGKLNEAAILFFDVRGFSAQAEKMQPQELLHALNQHLEVITNSVSQHEGTIVNFIGDAVLAVFNAPVPLENPSDAAFTCYRHCREQFEAMRQDRSRDGKVSFDLGAGLNFGTVVSGAIGSKNRFSFSVLGDEVNLAARLESLTRLYPVGFIVSQSARERLPDEQKSLMVRIDFARVKGREQPVELYALNDMDPGERKRFGQALDTYLGGDFGEAHKRFSQLSGVLAKFHAERCLHLQHAGQEWPGYFIWDTKG